MARPYAFLGEGEWFEIKRENSTWQAMQGEYLLAKKSAAVLLLLLGIVLVVIDLHEETLPIAMLGALSLLGGVFLLVLKIVRRSQTRQF
ncbi:hypothetical protein [Bradyrhizobium centrolobii]|nr:hypothetical protein [Bradyrhizobium centrolobii]